MNITAVTAHTPIRKTNMNDQIKTVIEALRDIRIPIHAYSCDHNMAEVLKKVDATITALTASADSTSAQDERSAFEQWVKRESNLFDLTLAPKMTCKDGRFPATYFDSEIETAWRAWANKPRASLASNLQGGPVAIAVVREHGDYQATIDWLLNPLPDGTLLYDSPQAQQSKPFNSKCCHKTVTKRCDGCPYDE